MESKIINCNDIKISNKEKIVIIAGPCQLENECDGHGGFN